MTELARGVRAYVIIGLLAALSALAGIFTLPPLDRDESRFAQATAQMLETGNFVEINFLATERNKKPVGIHWMQAVSVAVLPAISTFGLVTMKRTSRQSLQERGKVLLSTFNVDELLNIVSTGDKPF